MIQGSRSDTARGNVPTSSKEENEGKEEKVVERHPFEKCKVCNQELISRIKYWKHKKLIK